jgi:hypothetical protein
VSVKTCEIPPITVIVFKLTASQYTVIARTTVDYLTLEHSMLGTDRVTGM